MREAMRLVLELSKQGVPLLAGIDSPVIPGLVPGASINEELRTLVESGLSNYEALAAATRPPGMFIAQFIPNAKRSGVIDVGARADLVLLAARVRPLVPRSDMPCRYRDSGRVVQRSSTAHSQ